MLKIIKLFQRWVLYLIAGERCTCKSTKDIVDGCYICSPSFKLITSLIKILKK